MNATPCDRRPCGGRAAPRLAARLGWALALALAALAGCASLPAAAPTEPAGPWDPGYTPPAPPTSPRFVLEPAGPQHAEREHATLTASAEHLRATVFEGWPPPEFGVEQDRAELARHAAEFEEREAYAYTVLSPDRERSLGAVLLKPVRATRDGGHAVQLTYWVAAQEIPRGLDEHLVDSVLAWIDGAWPFDEVLVPLRAENRRAASLARGAGLVEHAPPSYGWRLFVRRR